MEMEWLKEDGKEIRMKKSGKENKKEIQEYTEQMCGRKEEENEELRKRNKWNR